MVSTEPARFVVTDRSMFVMYVSTRFVVYVVSTFVARFTSLAVSVIVAGPKTFVAAVQVSVNNAFVVPTLPALTLAKATFVFEDEALNTSRLPAAS